MRASDDPETTGERALARQLEVAQEITHIGSWEWDLASGDVAWSDELYRIYGLPPRSVDITLPTFLDRVHPEDRERVRSEVGAAIGRGSGRFAHRERIVRPDGSVRDLDTVGEVLCGADGKPKSLLGTCRDVTDERARERAIRIYADIFEGVQIAMSVWDAERRLVACNPATEAAVGRALESGASLAEVFPGDELAALMEASDGVRELAGYRLGGRVFAVKLFALPERQVGLALHDVSERERAQRVQVGERAALEMLASGAPLVGILTCIVTMIEDLLPGGIASILLVDEDGAHLRHGAGPGLPLAYRDAIDGAAIGPRAGSCGTSAYRRAPVYVADIEHDPLWEDYKAIALPHGLRACWSVPIIAADDRVLGTFAVYRREPCEADVTARELLGRAAHVAGIVLERRLLDEQLRALPGRIEAVREDERTGIAREIHDELGQALTAFKMDLAWLRRRISEPALTTKLDEMSGSADDVIHAVRRISAELRPGILDDLGLPAAIEWQAEEFERRTGITTVVDSAVGDLQLERGLATAAFRIFQEALTNVARHAGATLVEVSLALERGQLRLEVADDGVGLPDAIRRDALGLVGMGERARRQGGELQARRRAPRGTVIGVTLPLRFPTERRTDADKEIGP